jgi:hypothetical protein
MGNGGGFPRSKQRALGFAIVTDKSTTAAFSPPRAATVSDSQPRASKNVCNLHAPPRAVSCIMHGDKPGRLIPKSI